jgi:uncharacterized protein YhaN
MGPSAQSGETPETETVEVSADRLAELERRMSRLEDDQARLERQNDQLRSEVDQLEEENSELSRKLHEAKGLINSLRSKVDESDDTSINSELRDRVDDLRDDLETVKDLSKHTAGQVVKLKKRLEDGGDLAEKANDAAAADSSHGMTPETPLERIVSLPAADMDQLSANQERARWVASKAADLSSKSQAGRSLKASGMRRALDAAGRDSRPQTISRIFGFLDEFGDSTVTVKKTSSGERTAVFHGETAGRLQRLGQSEDHTVVMEGPS